ncbi:Proteasome subunit beta type-6 [Platanthera guangdongensis]|uniref:Proteasome subunit beta type-6 n=1 Tax=Platanthera guangdongensis TaxID=2320717 RepID=A0ABR2MDR4_9ASPA
MFYLQAADSQILSDYVRYFLNQHTIQLGQPATVKVAANLVRLFSYQNKNMLQTGLIIGGWDKYEGGQIYSVPLGGTVLKQPFTIGVTGLGGEIAIGMMLLRARPSGFRRLQMHGAQEREGRKQTTGRNRKPKKLSHTNEINQLCDKEDKVKEGSGSSYLYGFFDQAWKDGMSKDEAEKLVVKAVSLAIARDGASGGVVRTVTINAEGVTRNFYSGDSLPLWHEELEPRKLLA